MSKKTSSSVLFETIARILLGKAEANDPSTLIELKRRVVQFVNSNAGIVGQIQGAPRLVSLEAADAERSFTRWICDGQKPNRANAYCLVFALSRLGARDLASKEVADFRNALGKLASAYGTINLTDLERMFAMGADHRAIGRGDRRFATLRIWTDVTQRENDLPFRKVEGRYLVYRVPVAKPTFIYCDLLVIDELRQQDRCYGGSFYSAGSEWKCTILPSSTCLTVHMNAFEEKDSAEPPMHEVMLVNLRAERSSRFPYFVGMLLGLDEASGHPAAARVVLEKLDPSLSGYEELYKPPPRRTLRKGHKDYNALREVLFGRRGDPGWAEISPDAIARLPARDTISPSPKIRGPNKVFTEGPRKRDHNNTRRAKRLKTRQRKTAGMR